MMRLLILFLVRKPGASLPAPAWPGRLGVIFRLCHLRLRFVFGALLVLAGFVPTNGLVAEPVAATGIKRDGSDITVSFEAQPRSTYRLERKLELTDPSWQSIPGLNDLTAASNGPAQMTDSNALTLGKAFYRLNLANCDAGLASDSTNALDYAAAMELCQPAPESGTTPGLISAALTLASGTGTPAVVSRSIRTSFGSNLPHAGASMVVLSTGAAAASGQDKPAFTPFQPGLDTGTFSAAPPDWLATNGGVFPVAPGCPPAIDNTAVNPVMLTLRLRVPGYAHSFKIYAKFFTADFPESVDTAYDDMFVALLDSTYAGTNANPADKNLAVYITPASQRYPVGVNLASGNTGLFNDCVNGTTGCAGDVAGATSVCTGTSGLIGTGFDLPDSGNCNPDSLVGGSTGWLAIRGNVVPGETITLRLAIWDTGDGLSDSLVLLDDFSWSAETVIPGTTLE